MHDLLSVDAQRSEQVQAYAITEASKVHFLRIPLAPPLGNNTNPDDKLEFVLFFSNEYFGIKVDLNGKKNNQPGV